MEKPRRKGIMEKDTDSQHQLFAVAGSPYSGPSGGLVPDPYQITFEFLPKLNKIWLRGRALNGDFFYRHQWNRKGNEHLQKLSPKSTSTWTAMLLSAARVEVARIQGSRSYWRGEGKLRRAGFTVCGATIFFFFSFGKCLCFRAISHSSFSKGFPQSLSPAQCGGPCSGVCTSLPFSEHPPCFVGQEAISAAAALEHH